MFQAYGAGRCSSSAGRQVGATITTSHGDVIAVGFNEVAKAHGGQYWEGDAPDQRDHQRTNDSSTHMTQDILADLLERLRKCGWLNGDKSELSIDDLLQQASTTLLRPMALAEGDPPSLADKARLGSIIEFIRAVHAEMAALISAARRGVSVHGGTLYSTSFPCHECARHIVAAGIKHVFFIETYPKSRVPELYDDSIAVDEEDPSRVSFRAFTGIAPRIFLQMFAMPRRKSDDGTWLDWNKIRRRQEPRLGGAAGSYLEQESHWVATLDRLLEEKELVPREK